MSSRNYNHCSGNISFLSKSMTTTVEKGDRFVKHINSLLKECGYRAKSEIGSGNKLFKGDVRVALPFLLECKDHKKLSWLASIDQAKKQAEIGNYDRDKWALVVNDSRVANYQSLYAVVDFSEFIELLQRNRAPKVKEPDRDLAYLFRQQNEINKKIIKHLNK